MLSDGKCDIGILGMQHVIESDDIVPLLHIGLTDVDVLKIQASGEEVFNDDLTGQILNPDLVRAARKKELEYFDSKDVW